MFDNRLKVLVRGGGDLGSGVVFRLHRAGACVMVAELARPLHVRRLVSYGEAVYQHTVTVEGVTAVLSHGSKDGQEIISRSEVPVIIDPEAECIRWFKPHVIVDARLLKKKPERGLESAPLVIGLGPGFTAGVDCHAVIETMRGPRLGRVYWQGTTADDTKLPEMVAGYVEERVLRAPADGVFKAVASIGTRVERGQVLAQVDGKPITAKFDGVIRGMIADGILVFSGMKVGDLDPRPELELCYSISDKSLAIGGAVLEAVLTRTDLRKYLCGTE